MTTTQTTGKRRREDTDIRSLRLSRETIKALTQMTNRYSLSGQSRAVEIAMRGWAMLSDEQRFAAIQGEPVKFGAQGS